MELKEKNLKIKRGKKNRIYVKGKMLFGNEVIKLLDLMISF